MTVRQRQGQPKVNINRVIIIIIIRNNKNTIFSARLNIQNL